MPCEAPVTTATLREASDTPKRRLPAGSLDTDGSLIRRDDLVNHTSALPAANTDESALVQPVEAVCPGLDFAGTAEGVFTSVDLFPACEPIEDRRASVPHALGLYVEQIPAFGFKRVADVAECGAIRKDDLPIGARSRKQCPGQLRSAEDPAGQRNDATVTSGDIADILGVADTGFQAVDQGSGVDREGDYSRLHSWFGLSRCETRAAIPVLVPLDTAMVSPDRSRVGGVIGV